MATKYTGGASFGFSLNYNTAVPVDTRLVVDSLSDLLSPNTWASGTYNDKDDSKNVYVVYTGLSVAVVSEKAVYTYINNSVNGANIRQESSWMRGASINDVKSIASGALVYKGNRSSLAEITSIVNPAIGDMYNLHQQESYAELFDVVKNKKSQYGDGDEITVALSDRSGNVTLTVRINKEYSKCVLVDAAGYFYQYEDLEQGTWYKADVLYVNMVKDDYEHANLANVVINTSYDASIQGMNYACYERYSVFGDQEVKEGDTHTGRTPSGGDITGTVYFDNGYAYLKVVNGQTTTTYFRDAIDGVFVVFTATAPENKTCSVLGKWDALGSTMNDVPTRSELQDGSLKVFGATNADTLATARAIDGINFNGSAVVNRYTTCSTAAATAAKTVSVSNFTLTSGACVRVKFTNANTADDPTLNVASKGAKSIKLGSESFKDLKAGIVYQFVYDGSSWQVSGGGGSGDSDIEKTKLDEFATIKTDDTTVSGYERPYDIDILTLNTDDPRGFVVFKQMKADWDSADQKKKLKFIMCDGVKCKFDIESCATTNTTTTITFSLISKSKYYKVELSNVSGATSAHINFLRNGDDLGTVFESVAALGTVVNNHENRILALETSVATLDNRTTWYDLDSN